MHTCTLTIGFKLKRNSKGEFHDLSRLVKFNHHITAVHLVRPMYFALFQRYNLQNQRQYLKFTFTLNAVISPFFSKES